MKLLVVRAAGFIGGIAGVGTCPDKLAGVSGPGFRGTAM